VPLNLLGKKLFYLPKLLPEFDFPPRIIKPNILTSELLPFKLPPAVVWSAFEGAFVFFSRNSKYLIIFLNNKNISMLLKI